MLELAAAHIARTPSLDPQPTTDVSAQSQGSYLGSIMAKEQWSPETLRLREEAQPIIDKLNRSMETDRIAGGRHDDMSDDERESRDLTGKHLTAWLITSQYQTFDDLEVASYLTATSGAGPATTKGLAHYAAEAF